MDDFDKLVKSKIKNEKWKTSIAFDNTIKTSLDGLENRKIKKITPRKIIAIVAMITVVNVTTVFAMTPQGKEMIKGVVEFFNGQYGQSYISNKNNFDKFNVATGISVEDKGIKVTLDNIAVDDNFLNAFYTIESTEPIKRVQEDTGWTALFTSPFLRLTINGDENFVGNNNDRDAYFQSEKVLKIMQRQNISQVNVDDTFDLRITSDEIFGEKGNWIINTKVSKKDAKVETISVNPNQKATINLNDFKHDINIEKVTLSPFGNQIVISEEPPEDRFFSNFALYDDKGNSLDVLSTDLHGSSSGKVTNSYEFIKANKDMKYITLVPIDWEDKYQETVKISKDINSFPVNLDTNEDGKLIIQDMQFENNALKIDYKKEGLVFFASPFYFYDENGNEIDFGHVYLSSKIDRENGIYSEIFKFTNDNIDISKIKKIGAVKQDDYKLLKNQAIKIDLK
ncbi:DUF4179 domain-containing protein [Clostridium gasigenes]|uniref:DUF4179 domain-containing protein n=1 Tax=Clostridium gasigenes TaxID=94869 RepID=UPI0014383205|nr:DUF4179 domain-containing protein [Clostridium gasigenes]NKF08582.1 DUF4179 domain-containing protein [Clostridium gasigenes]QSW19589.1 DUF4179 domain-containing protein [Clostridium gasigenes]